MRISGGRLRGQKIFAGRGVYRPTQDRIRKAIFDHLGPVVDGLRVLDPFCGSGAFGIEAISRGASFVVFIDKERAAVEVTNRNLERLKVPKTAYRVFRGDAFLVLSRLIGEGYEFGLVFLDPPYNSGLYDRFIALLGGTSLLRPGGVVVAEHSKRIEPSWETGPFRLEDSKKYGDTIVTYLVKEG